MSTSLQAYQPIIIIGMHRSGTSMLARILRDFGVFMGCNRTRNEECRWINQLNNWMFAQASATWERPEGMQELLSSPESCSLIQDYLQGVVSGPASMRYLGLRHWISCRSLFRVTGPWGWKDPRNTFTLPLWLNIFPQAKILHITRHGMDVAQSLLTRHQKADAAAAKRYWRRRWLYVNNPLAPKRKGFAHNPRVARLEGGLALWRIYMQQARANIEHLGCQYLGLRYEDLLLNPESQLKQIIDFCDLHRRSKPIQAWITGTKSDRAYAYRNSQSLRALASRYCSWLSEFGYHA